MEKQYYNARFQCPDPLAKTAVSRSTRHRILKRRKLDEADAANGDDVEIGISEDESEFEEPVQGGVVNIESSESGSPSDDANVHTEEVFDIEEPVLTESEFITEYFDDNDLSADNDKDACADADDADDAEQSSDVVRGHVDEEKPLFEGCPLTPTSF